MSTPQDPAAARCTCPHRIRARIAKARSLPADVIILDLEDAVAPEAKEEARARRHRRRAEGGFGNRELVIRVNGLDTPWGEDDLAAIAARRVDAVLVPKVYRPADITACNAALADAPSRLAAVGDDRDLRRRAAARCASPRWGGSTRLSLFVMGVNDLAKEMRARLTPERTPFLPDPHAGGGSSARARHRHTRRRVQRVSRSGRVHRRGRAGTAVRVRRQDADPSGPDRAVQCGVLAPAKSELAWANAVIAAFDQPENAGKGAIRVDGKMVELLHLEQARQLTAIAEQIGRA